MPSAQVPAIEGWFTTDPEPALIGSRCGACGTVFFPKETFFCRNPHCGGSDLREMPLSRRGTLWSWTVNHYEGPPPTVAKPPYAVAAVELPAERIVVLGLVAEGTDPGALKLGDEMELVVETLFEEDGAEHLVWKWAKA